MALAHALAFVVLTGALAPCAAKISSLSVAWHHPLLCLITHRWRRSWTIPAGCSPSSKPGGPGAALPVDAHSSLRRSFGFLEGGIHSMEIKNVKPKESENAGFLLMRQNQAALTMIDDSNAEGAVCLWTASRTDKSLVVADFSLKAGEMYAKISEPGEYRVYFVNCRNSEEPVSFEVFTPPAA